MTNMKNKIYMDNSATTKVDKEVLEEMKPYFSEKYGNANSLHSFGREAKEALEKARGRIAKLINAEKEEIIFTCSGTESNNLAIKGLAESHPEKRHIITSKIEHPAILEVCKYLEKKGWKVDYISVDQEGRVDVNDIKNKVSDKTLLVSVMHVNNEIGSIQPIEEIAKICRERKVFFHTDAVQSFGKLNIDVKKQGIDLLSASSHKINGPKGVGILYVKKGIKISPLLHGGGQENKMRSSTENIPGIVGMGKAVELAKEKMKKEGKVREMRDYLLEKLLKIPGCSLNGGIKDRVFNNINVRFKDVEGESLVMMLDKDGIAASTGSACSSHSLRASHVLLALGLKENEAHGSLRLSLGWGTKKEEVNYVVKKTKEAVEKLRGIYGK